jgi:hypothetical protein
MMKLGQILVRQQAISPNTLEQVIAAQSQWSRPLGEILIGQGLIDEAQLNIALQEQYWRRNGFWVID